MHIVTTLFIGVLKGVKYLILDFIPVKLTSLVSYIYQSESRTCHYYLKLHAHIWAKRAWSRKFKFQMSNFTTGGLIWVTSSFSRREEPIELEKEDTWSVMDVRIPFFNFRRLSLLELIIISPALKYLWNVSVDITCGGLSEKHFISLGLWQNFNNYPPRYRRQPDRTSPWWCLRKRLRYPHISCTHGRWNRARKHDSELYIRSRKLTLC